MDCWLAEVFQLAHVLYFAIIHLSIIDFFFSIFSSVSTSLNGLLVFYSCHYFALCLVFGFPSIYPLLSFNKILLPIKKKRKKQNLELELIRVSVIHMDKNLG